MKIILISVIGIITRLADAIYVSIRLKLIPVPYHVINLAVLQYNIMMYEEMFSWDE